MKKEKSNIIEISEKQVITRWDVQLELQKVVIFFFINFSPSKILADKGPRQICNSWCWLDLDSD